MLILVPYVKIDHIHHQTMDMENLSLKLIITYRHIVFKEQYLTTETKMKKIGQEVMYYFKSFSSNYRYFVSNETCDKLILTSGKVFRNTNTIIKQGI